MFDSFRTNKSSEKDIRDWLAKQGYEERTAKFYEVELHAIKRPGWLQVFRFEVTATNASGESIRLFGAMRCDERYGPPNIMVSQEKTPREDQLSRWSDGLITHRRRQSR